MVNTRTDAELAAAVQNALQALLPMIRAEIREEFRTGSGPSGSGGNPPSVTIHTWLERFNKQKLRSFEKAIAPTRLAVYKFEGDALAWWKAYKQAKGGDVWLITTDTETSAEFMQRFLRLAGFLGAAAGTAEEQAKNFQWGLCKSTLNHLMCIPFTDVAQVANAARNYEILHKRDDDDAERGGGDNHRSNNNYSGNKNRLNFKSIRSSSTHKHDPNITISSSPGIPLRATPTRSALRVDADTQESVVELLVHALIVVKLAICRRIARRTPLRVHLVRLIRSQVHRVAFSPSLRIMLLRPQVPSLVHYLSMDM
nr:hypothetical protein [Tanacetum cinerariifolium]